MVGGGAGWRKLWLEKGRGWRAWHGWRAGRWLEGSSYLIPDALIVGGRTPCFAEVYNIPVRLFTCPDV